MKGMNHFYNYYIKCIIQRVCYLRSVAVWCIEDTANRVPTFITPIGAGHLSVVVSLQIIEVSKEVSNLVFIILK